MFESQDLDPQFVIKIQITQTSQHFRIRWLGYERNKTPSHIWELMHQCY